MPIELAPHNKLGLKLASPAIAGSGAAGFGDAWPPGVQPTMFGALVTAPISLRPLHGQEPPRLAEVPGGYLLATGDHNPGLRRVLRDDAPGWTRCGIPVVVALASTAPADWARLATHLEDETSASGLELALPAGATLSDVQVWVGAVRRAATLPLLVKLPGTHAAEWAGGCAEAGADALVLGTPPRAAYPVEDSAPVEAPLGGPAALPFTLQALRAVKRLDLATPLVAAGGIYGLNAARMCLAAGASAIQVRGLLWSDPAGAARLAAALRAPAEAGAQSNNPTPRASE
jgi:dihydroorotate dehydrogenase (NAD+) catalytic subunit